MKTTIIILAFAALLAYATMFGIIYSAMKNLCPNNYEFNWMGGQCVFTIHRSYTVDGSVTAPQEEGMYDMTFHCENGTCDAVFTKPEPKI